MSDSSSNDSSNKSSKSSKSKNSSDSSKISSVKDSENVSSQLNSKKSTKKDSDKAIGTDFKEKIMHFIKIDDLIRKKQEEIKELKDKKEEAEEFILKFLDKNDANFVNIPGGKLIKNQSETKAPLKIEMIKEAIVEGIKKEKLTDTEELNKKLLEDIIEIMENKRGKVNRVNLKRTFERTKKSKPKKEKK
jgi:hypothetical protein